MAETALVFTFNSATLPPPWKSLKPKNGRCNSGYDFSSRSWPVYLVGTGKGFPDARNGVQGDGPEDVPMQVKPLLVIVSIPLYDLMGVQCGHGMAQRLGCP